MRSSVQSALWWWLLGVCAASGQEWTRFRGPNGTGLGMATNLPVQWTEADVRWTIHLSGVGQSSPVLWGDRLYVTGADAATGKWRFFQIDARRGVVAWEKVWDLPSYTLHQYNTFATATAAVDADRVYVPRIEGKELRLTALTQTGEVAWEFNAGPFQTEHGLGHSPICHGGRVILAVDHDLAGRVVALEAATGRLVWETPRSVGKADYSTPCVHQSGDGPVELIFNTQEDGVSALDPRDGHRLWGGEKWLTMRSISSPVAARGLLVATCGSGAGGNYVVVLRPPVPPDTKPIVAYEVRRSAPYVPTPVALGDWLFLWSDGGVVSCLQSATGEVIWQERVGGNYFSSPVVADGKLIDVSTTGEVVVLSATDKFAVLGRSALGEGTEATPAIARGAMFFRTLSRVICVGGRD